MPYSRESYGIDVCGPSKDNIYYEAAIETFDVRLTVNGIETPSNVKSAIGQKIAFALDSTGHIVRCAVPVEALREGLAELLRQVVPERIGPVIFLRLTDLDVGRAGRAKQRGGADTTMAAVELFVERKHFLEQIRRHLLRGFFRAARREPFELQQILNAGNRRLQRAIRAPSVSGLAWKALVIDVPMDLVD